MLKFSEPNKKHFLNLLTMKCTYICYCCSHVFNSDIFPNVSWAYKQSSTLTLRFRQMSTTHRSSTLTVRFIMPQWWSYSLQGDWCQATDGVSVLFTRRCSLQTQCRHHVTDPVETTQVIVRGIKCRNSWSENMQWTEHSTFKYKFSKSLCHTKWYVCDATYTSNHSNHSETISLMNGSLNFQVLTLHREDNHGGLLRIWKAEVMVYFNVLCIRHRQHTSFEKTETTQPTLFWVADGTAKFEQIPKG
jgi:hypothetical protein